MSSFQQIGDRSHNLLAENCSSAYRGAIINAVNYSPQSVRRFIMPRQRQGAFDIVLDPQLYTPRHAPGKLAEWRYFPRDFDTADFSSPQGWRPTSEALIEEAEDLGVDWCCSPVSIPYAFTESYYRSVIEIGHEFCDIAQNDSSVSPMQSVIVNTGMLESLDQVRRIASIVTQSSMDRLYLVLYEDHDIQWEHADIRRIRGAMRLIREISSSGMSVFCAFSSSDVGLYKYAGAEDCATGKFFSLRKFTRSRFDDQGVPGRPTELCVEEALFANIQESDLIALREMAIVSDANRRNEYYQEIMSHIDSPSRAAWLKRSWMQYLWWFADFESRVTVDAGVLPDALELADRNWMELDQRRFLFQDRRNTGDWVRQWRIALSQFLDDW